MGNFQAWLYIFKLGEAGAEGEYYLPRRDRGKFKDGDAKRRKTPILKHERYILYSESLLITNLFTGTKIFNTKTQRYKVSKKNQEKQN